MQLKNLTTIMDEMKTAKMGKFEIGVFDENNFWVENDGEGMCISLEDFDKLDKKCLELSLDKYFEENF